MKGGRLVKHFGPMSSSVPKRVDSRPRTLHHAEPMPTLCCSSIMIEYADANMCKLFCFNVDKACNGRCTKPFRASFLGEHKRQNRQEIVQVKLPFGVRGQHV